MFIYKIVQLILAPTYFFADYKKEKLDKKRRAFLIKKYNRFYLGISILIAVGFLLDSSLKEKFYNSYYFLPYLIIWLLPLSRCNEIFYSFIRDAIDKVEHKATKSDLTFGDRIKLSLNSYLELILNFAIIYFLLPKQWFNLDISNMVDSLYFSGVTITTLGYGDISPTYWLTKFLVIYEVFCGFILLIVSFAIYTGRGLSSTSNNRT